MRLEMLYKLCTYYLRVFGPVAECVIRLSTCNDDFSAINSFMEFIVQGMQLRMYINLCIGDLIFFVMVVP